MIANHFFGRRRGQPAKAVPSINSIANDDGSRADSHGRRGGEKVPVGVLLIPLIIMLAFAPNNWPRFCMTLALTSLMTVFGAFLGHLLVKPTRISRS